MQPNPPTPTPAAISSASPDIASSSPNSLTRWGIRAWFAALLLFSIQVPFANPTVRAEWIDLPLVLFGFLAITALVFDLGSRLGAWGVLGTLVLGGMSALLAFIFTLPPLPGAEPLLAFLSRVLGGGTLSAWGAWLFGLWMFRPTPLLLSRRIRLSIGVWALSALAGFLWDLWLRWNRNSGTVSPDSFIVWWDFSPYILAGMMVVRLILASRRWVFRASDFRLRRADWLFVAPTLITLFIVRINGSIVSSFQTVIALMLLLMGVAILYFRQQPRRRILFESLTTRPSRIGTLLIAGGALFGGVYLTSRLPPGTPPRDAASIVAFGFLTFGIVWLPALTLIIGARAFIKQARAYRL